MTAPAPSGEEALTQGHDEELQMGGTQPEVDADVTMEKQRIMNTPLSKLDDTLVLNELRKVYKWALPGR